MQPIDLTLLRRKDPDPYRVDTGDTLAIIAADVFGDERNPIPVNQPDAQNPESSSGYPVSVRDDGKISLPIGNLTQALDVKGKSLREVEELIRDTLVTTGQFQPGKARVSVQLARRRSYRVYVQREDTQQIPLTGQQGGALFTNKKGAGVTVFLQEGRNDVLNALNLAGGPADPDFEKTSEFMATERSLPAGAPGVQLAALFSPEHGIRGQADAALVDTVDEKTGLPIYSLYGNSPPRLAGQDREGPQGDDDHETGGDQNPHLPGHEPHDERHRDDEREERARRDQLHRHVSPRDLVPHAVAERQAVLAARLENPVVRAGVERRGGGLSRCARVRIGVRLVRGVRHGRPSGWCRGARPRAPPRAARGCPRGSR
jgi:protein involved in polysaccharide export with SLBB domain